MKFNRIVSGLVAITMAFVPVVAMAAGELSLSTESHLDCLTGFWTASFDGGTIPYTLSMDFGDGDEPAVLEAASSPTEFDHLYPGPGDYDWLMTLNDGDAGVVQSSGTLSVAGPTVTLVSNPSPPMVFMGASVEFTASASGGFPEYTYEWDLDGDGAFDAGVDGNLNSYTYDEAGKFVVTVVATDECGMTAEATLAVVVLDPEAEACHPMAQRIAEAVSTLFPTQAEQTYTCEDIFAIFEGALTGSQTGFGRLWHAYKLSLSIEELTWEEILNWHLESNGWGLLMQLDRFADTLDDIGIRDMMDLVLSGEASVQEIRHAVNSVLRYEADFEDALARLQDGASPGELGRFYRAAQDLELDPSELDGYLESGFSLQELSHAARVADRIDADWEAVAEAHQAGNSWGAINQAQRLAGEGEDWTSVLENGIRETREQNREEAQAERNQQREQSTAEHLAQQFGVSEAEVWSLFNGSCSGDWNCVRRALRESNGHGPGGGPKKND